MSQNMQKIDRNIGINIPNGKSISIILYFFLHNKRGQTSEKKSITSENFLTDVPLVLQETA